MFKKIFFEVFNRKFYFILFARCHYFFYIFMKIFMKILAGVQIPYNSFYVEFAARASILMTTVVTDLESSVCNT